MLKKTITYTDQNGVERTEDFYFNLSKAEIAEMALEIPGGMTTLIERITKTKDTPSLVKIFKEDFNNSKLVAFKFKYIDSNLDAQVNQEVELCQKNQR